MLHRRIVGSHVAWRHLLVALDARAVRDSVLWSGCLPLDVFVSSHSSSARNWHRLSRFGGPCADKLREHDVQDIREQVQELQQQAMLLRMHNYSVTPANRVGQLLLRNARRCVVEHLLPIMHLSVPDGVSSLLGKWGSYSKEEQIQVRVQTCTRNIFTPVRHASARSEYLLR